MSVTAGSPSPTVTSSGPLTTCTGGIDTLDAGAGYSTYLWSTTATTRKIVVTQTGNYTCSVTLSGCQGVSNTVTVTIGNSLNPSISATPSLTVCTGSSALLDAGAGYSSYAWSNGATTQTISAGATNTYSVTVSQGGCNGSTSANVSVGNFPLTVNVTPVGPISACAGTNITLDAGAGYAGYSWSNGATTQTVQATTTNSYSVTVTRNSCTGTGTVQVTLNSLPHPAITSQQPLANCVGNTVTLDAGSGFNSYAWSNGATSQTTQVSTGGAYSVSVIDNNTCPGNDTVNVTFDAVPSPSIISNGTPCGGHSVSLDAGAGFSGYLWSNAATTETISVNTSGTYNVTVTQGACSGVASNPFTYTASQLPVESVGLAAGPGGTTIVQVSPTGATYQWLSQQTQGGAYTQENETSQSFTVACGTIPVYYTAIVSQGGCNDTSSTIEVVCTAINNISALASFSVQPNPAADVLHISYHLNEITPMQIAVIDLTGRPVITVSNGTENQGDQQRDIRLSELAPGIYILNFTTPEGSFNTRFVKQ